METEDVFKGFIKSEGGSILYRVLNMEEEQELHAQMNSDGASPVLSTYILSSSTP